jgi:hypothetical protein
MTQTNAYASNGGHSNWGYTCSLGWDVVPMGTLGGTFLKKYEYIAQIIVCKGDLEWAWASFPLARRRQGSVCALCASLMTPWSLKINTLQLISSQKMLATTRYRHVPQYFLHETRFHGHSTTIGRKRRGSTFHSHENVHVGHHCAS